MRRPWNAIDSSIYSLVTVDDGQSNMNICSYVMPVSRQPKIYAVAIDPDTHTYHLLQNSDTAVLQLLHQEQKNLVRTLGKKSGVSYDKLSYLKKKNLLTSWQNFPVLINCCAWLYLEKLSEYSTGDHQLFIFKSKNYKMRTDHNILTWGHLVASKIIL